MKIDGDYKLCGWKLLLFRYIVRDAVIQSRHHEDNICDMYQVIGEETRRQFTEDNLPTLRGFLNDCYDTVRL